MKKADWINLVIITAIILLFGTGCKKEEPPTIPVVSTTTVTNLTWSTAICGGNITSDGRSAVKVRGVCWSTNDMPFIQDSKTVDGSGTGTFTSSIGDLIGGTAYHVRAYATNSVGIAYGETVTFTTPGHAPIATTELATNISGAGATLNGTVDANGISANVAFEYGTTTGYGQEVTPGQNPVMGDSITSVSADISGLTPGAIYHFRVKAENYEGTVYGDDITFITLFGLQAPIVSTNSVTNISTTGATLNGTVNANGLSANVTFEYDSTATSYGNNVTAFQSPVTGDSITNVSADISGLIPGVTYHFRAKAENPDGDCYGDDVQFTLFTCNQVPAVTTKAATNISRLGATLSGTVNANGWPTTVTFSYQVGLHRGRWYWRKVSAVPDTVTGDSIIHVSASVELGGRSESKTHQFWVSATNACGTVTGNVMTLTTP
jgi:hypothetical protein